MRCLPLRPKAALISAASNFPSSSLSKSQKISHNCDSWSHRNFLKSFQAIFFRPVVPVMEVEGDVEEDEEEEGEELVEDEELDDADACNGSGRSSAPPHNLALLLSSKLILLLNSSSYNLRNRSTLSGLITPMVPCPGKCINEVGVGPALGSGRSGREVQRAWSLAARMEGPSERRKSARLRRVEGVDEEDGPASFSASEE